MHIYTNIPEFPMVVHVHIIPRFPHSLFVSRTCRFWNSSAERAGFGKRFQQRLDRLGLTSTMEIPKVVTQMHSISWLFLELRGVLSAILWDTIHIHQTMLKIYIQVHGILQKQLFDSGLQDGNLLFFLCQEFNDQLRMYVHLILSCGESNFTTVWATVCSSWVQINCFTGQRSRLLPEGDTSRRYIEEANTMMSRIAGKKWHTSFSYIYIYIHHPLNVCGNLFLFRYLPMEMDYVWIYMQPASAQVCIVAGFSGCMRWLISFGATWIIGHGGVLQIPVVHYNSGCGLAQWWYINYI